MPTWVYRTDGKFLVSDRAKSGQHWDAAELELPFKQRIRRALYHLECKEGSKFRVPGHSKEQLSKVWNEP